MRKFSLLALAIALGIIYACSGASQVSDYENVSENGHAHEGMHITNELISELELGTYVVDSGYIYNTYKFPAHIVESRNSSAVIRARFPGIVIRVLKRQGDKVKKDQIIAYIESDESFSPYPVHSPISGVISEQMVSEGEAVEKGQPLMKVINLDEVWVKGMIYPQKSNIVREGQNVEVHRHFGDRYVKLSGKIFLISPEVDEDTRLLPIFISVKNENNLLKPGMYGDIIVKDSFKVAMRAPLEAIHIMNQDTVVFVKRGEEVEHRKVSTGRKGSKYVEILKGLSLGDTVFSRNSFIIRAEIEKETWMGEGHSH